MRKVHVVLQDDIDGGEPAHTLYFSLEDKAYEIDLTEQNATSAARFLGTLDRSGPARLDGTDSIATIQAAPRRRHGRHPALGAGERHPGQRPRAHLGRPAHPIRGSPLTGPP